MRTRDQERSAGLSKESAGKASNLMRRPAQRRNRNATTSACVGWDFINIENRPNFRKQAQRLERQRQPPSKRLDNHQDHNSDHHNRRYLIDNTVESRTFGISIGSEILNPSGKKTVDSG
jgi:hypothetical protein